MKRPPGIDKRVVDVLTSLGSDPNREHPVEFFLYFPEEYQAYAVAAELSNLSFNTIVSYSENGDDWLCFAVKALKPTTDRLVELGNWMEELAEKYNGHYDGWGTPVIPDD